MNLARFFCSASLMMVPLTVQRTAVAQEAVVQPAAPRVLDMAAGRLHITFGAKGSLKLLADGTPVVTASHLYLVKQGWTGLLLNTDDATPTRLESHVENGIQVGIAEYENTDAYARYRFELRGDNSLTVHLTYGVKTKVSAQVEYAAGLVNANVLQAQSFTADTVQGTRGGIIPLVAAAEDQEKSRVTPFFKSLKVQSPLGPLTVTASGNHPITSVLNLFDARKSAQDWAQQHPVFWLGIGSPAQTVLPGDNTVSVTFALGSAPRRTEAAALSGTPRQVFSESAARIPWSPERPLIPLPKEVTEGASPLRLNSGTRIVLASPSPTPEEKHAAEELQKELATFWGVAVPVITAPRARRGDIVLGLANVSSVDPPAKPEGYCLETNSAGATLAGYDARGVYNAAQTFKQLLRVNEKGVYVKPVRIRDWPTLSARGVHWFGGPNSWPFHERMISRIIAPLKYNQMVYEVETSQWDSQPRIRDYRSTPKEQVRKTVDYARAHLLEPIPLVNTFGHMEWLFVGGQNLDIASDPTHPYAIDPENPRTYDVLFGVMDEAIALFQPKRFHIGHDEVTLEGKFPRDGSKKSVTELLLQNVSTIHHWLAKKNIQTMMWGDMLLHPGDEGSGGAAFAPSLEESARRRNAIPKDVQIADWHYWASGLDYPSIAVFQKEGFGVLASPWMNPNNISNFAQVAARDKAMGLLQTTWAGWTMTVDGVKGESFPQFVGYLRAAEDAWNGGANTAAGRLNYSAEEEFLALWDRMPTNRTKRRGFTVDLSSLSNTAVWGWSPLTASTRHTLPAGNVLRAGIRFRTGHPVLLAGALNPPGAWPRSITLPLNNRKATSLAWLLGTSYAAPLGTTVAKVNITYADGRTATVPILYGKQAMAFTDTRGATDMQTAATSSTPGGETAKLRVWTWTNPRPDIALTSITLTSETTEAAPVLLGITGVE